LSIAITIGGIAFAAGIAYDKSTTPDINYSRASKFRVPQYGSIKDMETVELDAIFS